MCHFSQKLRLVQIPVEIMGLRKEHDQIFKRVEEQRIRDIAFSTIFQSHLTFPFTKFVFHYCQSHTQSLQRIRIQDWSATEKSLYFAELKNVTQ